MNHKYLNIDTLKLMNKHAKPMPILPLHSADSIVTCPICSDCKPFKLVTHANCDSTYCIDCILELFNQGEKTCPLCRSNLLTGTANVSSFIGLTKLEQGFIDNLLFFCKDCNQSIGYNSAIQHHTNCLGVERHQPPSDIPTRGDSNLIYNELVSNPTNCPPPDAGTRRFWFNVYHDGKQILTSTTGPNQTVDHIKGKIVKVLSQTGPGNVTRDQIKIYKFSHEELNESLTAREILTNKGINYLTSSSSTSPLSLQPLSQHTAHLIFHEAGPKPHIQTTKSSRTLVEEEQEEAARALHSGAGETDWDDWNVNANAPIWNPYNI